MKLISGVIAAVCVIALGQALAGDTPGGDYRIHVVTRDAIPVTLSFAGTVSADKTLQLTAQMPGRIAAIAGQEGDRDGEAAVGHGVSLREAAQPRDEAGLPHKQVVAGDRHQRVVAIIAERGTGHVHPA